VRRTLLSARRTQQQLTERFQPPGGQECPLYIVHRATGPSLLGWIAKILAIGKALREIFVDVMCNFVSS
jgi:hypothetical protein